MQSRESALLSVSSCVVLLVCEVWTMMRMAMMMKLYLNSIYTIFKQGGLKAIVIIICMY